MKGLEFELVDRIFEKYEYVFSIFGKGKKTKYVTLHFDKIVEHIDYMKHLGNGNVLVKTIDYDDPAHFPEIETERQDVSFTDEDYRLALVAEGYIK